MNCLLKHCSLILFSTTWLIWIQLGHCWNNIGVNPTASTTSNNNNNNNISRRKAIATGFSGLIALSPSIICHAADDNDNNDIVRYEFRDRFSNKGAIIREDYYYMMGSTPPRILGGPLKLDDPEWNAFGSCTTKEGGSSTNSCTYVSLSQRIPAYSKYGFSISLGAKEYSMLKKAIEEAAKTNTNRAWDDAASYVTTLPQTTPPPTVDALLKMVLFASAMLTSPNYSGPSKELLVARFYANEVGFAVKEIAAAIDAKDPKRALLAWDFGKDSWNSYFQIVNDKVSPKVGDKFELL